MAKNKLQITVDVYAMPAEIPDLGPSAEGFTVGDEFHVRSPSVALADKLRRRLGLVHKRRILEETLPPVKRVGADLSFKQKLYDLWVDEPLAELEGKTPAQAAADSAARPALRRLLGRLKATEARLEPAARYDFSGLERRLGL